MALQVDKCAAFGRWTECQIKANKAVDGSTANAEPSPTRQSDDTERGEWLAFMIPHRHDDLTSAQLGLGGCRYGSPSGWKRSTATSVVGSRPASEALATRPPGSVSLMFSSRSKTSSAVTMTPERQWMPLEGHRPHGDDAAGDAFDKLRGVVRECKKGATGFDHDHFSKETLPGRDMTSTPIPIYWPNGWSRTSREQPGTSPKLQWLGGAHNRCTKPANGFDPWTFPLTRCSHFVLMPQ